MCVRAGVGVERWSALTGAFASLSANGVGTSVAMDLFGNVFASFAGWGVYEYDSPSGWHQLRNVGAAFLGLGR